MRRPRYALRSLLLFAAIIAIALAAYPRIRRYIQWRNARISLKEWASNLKRDSDGVEEYMYLSVSFDPSRKDPLGGVSYSVMTAEPEMGTAPDGTVTWTTHAGTVPDLSRFFVIPPGKWVDNIEEVIETWDRYQSDGYEY